MQVCDSAVIDLFCGVGGLTHGFVRRNFPVIAGIDSDVTCKYAYEVNNKADFIHAKVEDISSEQLLRLYPENVTKILVGCAPCQPFSSYTAPKSRKEKQWSLLYEFGRLVREVRPEIVSMENVSQLKTFRDGEIFNSFVGTLEGLGYYVWHDIVKAYEYGIPQNRRRLVLLASRLGPIELVAGSANPRNYVTVREAIGFLPPLADGETHPSDRLHRARKLSDVNKKRIKATPEGGSWLDWEESLVSNCHKKKTGQTYKSVYGRMKWDEIAPTMTTQCTGYGNGRFGHPEQDRAISLREAAIIQSFPPDYEFFNPQAKFFSTWIEKHIGNAVPVGLGEAIAKSIEAHLISTNQ